MNVLTSEFNDDHSFTHTDSFTGITRSWGSFDEAGTEVSESRIAGGIHFRFTVETSDALAETLAAYTTSTSLQRK